MDAGLPRWTGTGRASQTHTQANDNIGGLASQYDGPLEWVATEVGVIGLKYGGTTVGYRPRVSELKTLPYRDTRYTAISDRYYR